MIAVRRVRASRLFSTAVLTLLLILCWTPIFLGSSRFHVRRLLVHLSSAAAADDSLPSLTALCDSTEWNPHLWVRCTADCGPDGESFCGGLTNARNRVSLCVRLAIDAGAGGVLIPAVSTRDPKNPTDTNYGAVCPDEYFDTAHLAEAVGASCPKLQMRFCTNTTQLAEELGGPVEVIPTPVARPVSGHHFTETMRNGTMMVVDAWKQEQQQQQQQQKPELRISDKTPAAETLVVHSGDPIYSWDWARSNETLTIRRELSKTLRYSPRLRDAGTRILGALPGSFVAVHLRGESDWPPAWGTRAQQVQAYAGWLGGLNDTAARDVYVSCGDQSAIAEFRSAVEKLGMGYVVHDKMSLLEGDDNNNNNDYNNKNNNGGSGSSNSLNATLLDGMNFDHQGGVEYEIMVQASYFLGISTSTMSLMAAYARTVDAELVNGLDYWQGLIYPGTELTQGKWSMNRNYQYDNHKIRGDGTTNLMVVSGPDMMEYFP